MRRVTMLAAFVAALLMMTAGIALADNFRGNDRDNRIVGTDERDRIDGLAGDDDLLGKQGNDTILGNRGDDDLYGGAGRDRLDGGRGDDFIRAQGDGRVDRVVCGAGRDVVQANPEDNLAGDCEVARSL